MQINPQEIIDRGIVKYVDNTKVQQVGIDLSIMQKFTLKNGESLNVNFAEKINLPDDIYALFYQRSSFSRKGIFTTTGVYDPGYVGSLGCTIYNMSGNDITIENGERLGQLICYKADAASSYQGQWQNK